MSDERQERPHILKVILPNGRVVQGTTDAWITALLGVLSVDQQVAAFVAVEKNLIRYETPGNYVIHCEPFRIGADVKPLGGNGKR